MSQFITSLVLAAWPAEKIAEQKVDRQQYDLAAPFGYHSDLIGLVVMPVGFTTDFASIPRALWNVLDPEDPCILYPSVVHDYIYSRQGVLETQTIERSVADQVLIEAMTVCGAPAWKRESVFRAVRWFGGRYWTPNA